MRAGLLALRGCEWGTLDGYGERIVGRGYAAADRAGKWAAGAIWQRQSLEAY